MTLGTVASVFALGLLYSGVLAYGLITAHFSQAATVTWDGGGSDTNWSTAANWTTDTAPSSTDIVIFDGTSVTSSVIDGGFHGTVTGVQILSGYTGSIPQNRSLTVTGAFIMGTSTAGIFLGGTTTIDINGEFTLRAGTFRATSATTSIASHFLPTGGTFEHNNGTIEWDGGVDPTIININTDLTLANLTINKTTSSIGMGYEENGDGVVYVTGTLRLVNGQLTKPNPNERIIIEAQGPVIHETTWGGGGTSIIRVTGAARTIELAANGSLSRLDIDAPGTVVNMNGTGTTTIFGLRLLNGTFNINSGHLNNPSFLTVDGAASTFTSTSSGRLYIESQLIVTNGGTITLGTGSIQIGTAMTVSGSGSSASFASSSQVVFEQDSGQLTETISVGAGATFSLPSTTTYISAATTTISGTLNHNNGTVILDGNTQALAGNPTFYNLTKTVTTTATTTLHVPSNATTTIAGALTVTGTSTGHFYIYGSTPGTQANIDPQGPRTISNVELRDIRNRGSTIDVSGQNVVDGGNNGGFLGMIDLTYPTPPGNLTISSVAPGSATVAFGGATTEVNFREYKMFYKLGSAGVTTTDTRSPRLHSALGSITYGGATTTIVGGMSDPSVPYVMNIGSDAYNNVSRATANSRFIHRRIPTNLIAVDVTSSTMAHTWSANGNAANIGYNIEDSDNAGRSSGWVTSTSYTFRNLTPAHAYRFEIKARNTELRETDFVLMASPENTLPWSSGSPSPPPPPPPPTPGAGDGSGNTGGGAGETAPDDTPPETVAAFTINDGAAETDSRAATLYMNVSAATDMAFSNTPDFAESFFVPYAATYPWTLTDGAGEKTVTARFRSSGGTYLDLEDSIRLVTAVAAAPSDESPPQAELPTLPASEGSEPPTSEPPGASPATDDNNNAVPPPEPMPNPPTTNTPAAEQPTAGAPTVIGERLSATDVGVWIGQGRIRAGDLSSEAVATFAGDTVHLIIRNARASATDLEEARVNIGDTSLPFTPESDAGVHRAVLQVHDEDSITGEIAVTYRSGETQRFPFKIESEPFGVVKDSTTNAPLEGVTVTLFTGDGGRWPSEVYGQSNPQITHATGEYGFIVPPGVYELEMKKDGYTTTRERVSVTNALLNLSRTLPRALPVTTPRNTSVTKRPTVPVRLVEIVRRQLRPPPLSAFFGMRKRS